MKLPSVFSDHMVLQRNVRLPVWGLAAPGERISISLGKHSTSTMAAANGRWRAMLPPLQAGRGLQMKVSAGRQGLIIRDISMGEVWLLAGDQTVFARATTAAAPLHKRAADIRVFDAVPCNAVEPQFDLKGGWLKPGQDSPGGLPALALHYATKLALESGVPVGIINLAGNVPLDIVRDGVCKGTPVEAFISRPSLEAEAAARPILDYFAARQELKDALNAYGHALDDWKFKNGRALGAELKALEQREPDVWYDYVSEMRKSNDQLSLPPKKPTAESLGLLTNRPAELYNSMVAPVAGYAIRGVVWSQGTANLARAYQYRVLLACLIGDLRRSWNNPGLPVVLLELPPFYSRNIDPRTYAELREAQVMMLKLPATALAVTEDLPVQTGLLPGDYSPLADRLVTAAAELTGKKSARPPRVVSVRFADGQVVLTYDRPLSTAGGGALRGFAIAGEPFRWAYAVGTIKANVVILSHPKIKQPVAVRYNWVTSSAQRGNLSSDRGLAAALLRSDQWPCYTQTSRAVLPNAQAPVNRIDLYPAEDPSLPYILLIGDSIMGGYYETVVEQLQGKANVWALTSGLAPGESARRVASEWSLQDKGNFAVIHFNDGLHSMPPRETDEQFRAGLQQYIASLQPLGARLIWATITPSPDKDNQLSEGSGNPAVIRRNAISKAVARQAGIAVDDLYEAVIHRREDLQGFANLHFTPEGSRLLGRAVGTSISKALENNLNPPKP